MPSDPDYLVLDVDGVLIGGFPRVRWDATMEADLGVRPKMMQRHFFQKYWQDVMRGFVPVEEPLGEFLAAHYPDISVEQLLSYWHGNDAVVAQHVIDAAIQWKERTGGQLALATNQDRTRARYICDDLGFADIFETVIVSCNIGCAKPEAEYYRQGDLLLGRTPDQTALFLDDMMDHVEAAIAHGWQARHVESLDHAADIIERL